MAALFPYCFTTLFRWVFIFIISHLWLPPKLTAMSESKEKKISLNFFQLNPTIENADPAIRATELAQIANVFQNMPESFQPIELLESTINLYGSVENRNSFHLGTFVRAQTVNIPPDINLQNAELTPLPLNEGHGLGFPTCFLYEPATRIVMIESTKNAIGMGVFSAFLERNFVVPSLDAAFVINPRKLAEYGRMNVFTKLLVKVARIEHGTIFNTPKRAAIGQIIHAADNTNADILEYKIEKRGKGETLARSVVRQIVRSFTRYRDTDELKKLIVSGKEDDDSPVNTVDFIIQKLKDSITVRQRRLVESFEINEHYSKLIDVYKTHQAALAIYRPA
jgi:hypothetical protein